ncbi:MAG: ubiquinol-cytochrome C reductase [Ignavibacteria bacterium GWB2_35_12]|nr:MAG: ubiquinol-cytochrome C reductase [Ignavibacteria bacterium GWA2_35_8]OGU38130.1 MAG: ubiquinol-cytochrome C reductase [Ignavibacteria bacterium GWB2_35_12]OGU87023.1 MAG: ubiquinol-cytochrome C reductase [Ignavibacteria bacterium RIFOXYA2_FULL_35_10]OGV24902.1 MAG: ubiquinol-cytochrome C reductase [Ignavibacteria bacterium RIFOXYC2_FULL_35_21]
MGFWLIKSDPSSYSWEQFLKDKKTVWDGVRNYQARNNLAAMKVGDKVLFYHSDEGKCIVGISQVSKKAFPEPKDKEGKWLAVELKIVKKLKKPVTLVQIRKSINLKNISLLKQPRLSVMLITDEEFQAIIKLSE